MANAVIVIDMVRGFLEEGHPLYCGETARSIIPKVQTLLEREIARGSKILYLCDYHEPEESLIVARQMKGRLGGVRLDTPSERGGVTVDLVKETRARLDLAGYKDVKIFVSGGITPDTRHYPKSPPEEGDIKAGMIVR